jgi:hypothetical protein
MSGPCVESRAVRWRAIAVVATLIAAQGLKPRVAFAQDGFRHIDTTETMIVPRSVDSILVERERIGRLRGEADARMSTARAREAETETQIELFDLMERQLAVMEAQAKFTKR